ncbi:MAG TPA: hypothetical protein VFZ97_05895 [Acidimicrobiales bacterium]
MGAGAGAVGLAAMEIGLPAATASASEDSQGNSGSGVEGAWRIVHTDTTPDTDSAEAIVTFADGGGLVARDINPPGDAQLGAWRATGDRRFVATFFDSFSEGPSGPVHIVKVIVKGTVDDDNDKISGTYTFTITPPPPEFPASGGTGTFEGSRLVAGS